MNPPSIDKNNSELRAILIEGEEPSLANLLTTPLFLDQGLQLFAKKNLLSQP